MPDQLSPLPFRLQEYQDRVERTREEMERRGLDCLIVNAPVSLNYLSGIEIGTSLAFLLIPASGEATFILRKTELSNANSISESSWVKHAFGVDDAEDPIRVLTDVLEQLPGKNSAVGIEAGALFLTAAQFIDLRRLNPDISFQDATDIVGNLRTIKSESELVYMRKAGKIAAGATERAIGTIREGMADRELAAELLTAALQLGTDPMPKLPYVTTGTRTFQAHSSWNGSIIQAGDIVNTEIACTAQHYNATVFRVSVVGEPSDRVKHIHEASRAGLLAGMESIGPGMTSHQADRMVREPIEAAGFGELFVVRAAYGIGLGFPPSWSDSFMQIRPNDERILQQGMCFHLVPALYEEGVGAVCCSMSIEVTENGCQPLTPIEPKLFVV